MLVEMIGYCKKNDLKVGVMSIEIEMLWDSMRKIMNGLKESAPEIHKTIWEISDKKLKDDLLRYRVYNWGLQKELSNVS